ncbi:MAG: hypothetical protein JSV58_01880 [Candidatus Bathyarchaeota archaeon]|nr:MAG: hypothetical protein JSV58_01880 [Candidatus Bathyarchaeota archaeon]
MKRQIPIVCIAILILSFLVTAVSAVPPPIHLLPGQRINVFSGDGTEFETSQTTHVIHGWRVAWGSLTRQQKIEFLLTAEFHLYIDGEHIYWIESAFWHDVDADEVYAFNYIVFSPFTFSPGTYEFRGVWYAVANGIPESFESTVKVTVLV